MTPEVIKRARRKTLAETREQNRRRGRVETPDGPGKVIGKELRVSGHGPCRQYRVELDDGRVRHHKPRDLQGVNDETR